MTKSEQQDYLYKTVPFTHQRDIFLISRELEAFALFMEQGTGKSKVIIDTGAFLYSKGTITAIAVIAPNGVHHNWLDELEVHCPEYTNYKALAWESGKSKTKRWQEEFKLLMGHENLKVFTMNVDAVNTKSGYEAMEYFLIHNKALLTVDESQDIKTPKAQRTKNVLKLATKAEFRRILTGTPVAQGPLDIFTQMKFLDEEILGFGSFYAFRNHFAILEQERNWRSNKIYYTINGYKNMEELTELLEPHSYRVLKEDCLDLPPKLYEKVYVELSVKQRKLYDTLKKELVVEFDGAMLSVQNMLIRMLRLTQITGGHFPYDDAEGGKVMRIEPNPSKLVALMEIVERIPKGEKIIIWARFTAEIELIAEALKGKYGENSLVLYYGATSSEDRRESIRRFKYEGAQFFVSNPLAGGTGLDLWVSSHTIYYDNDFRLVKRLQSEDRNHRIGQVNKVTYYDIIARNTLDTHIVKALRDKKKIADLITGDNIKDWL